MESSTAERTCRICRGSGGPMIRPCRCGGSMLFAHPFCLAEWSDRRSQLSCEVCNTNYVVFEASSPRASATKSSRNMIMLLLLCVRRLLLLVPGAVKAVLPSVVQLVLYPFLLVGLFRVISSQRFAVGGSLSQSNFISARVIDAYISGLVLACLTACAGFGWDLWVERCRIHIPQEPANPATNVAAAASLANDAASAAPNGALGADPFSQDAVRPGLVMKQADPRSDRARLLRVLRSGIARHRVAEGTASSAAALLDEWTGSVRIHVLRFAVFLLLTMRAPALVLNTLRAIPLPPPSSAGGALYIYQFVIAEMVGFVGQWTPLFLVVLLVFRSLLPLFRRFQCWPSVRYLYLLLQSAVAVRFVVQVLLLSFNCASFIVFNTYYLHSHAVSSETFTPKEAWQVLRDSELLPIRCGSAARREEFAIHNPLSIWRALLTVAPELLFTQKSAASFPTRRVLIDARSCYGDFSSVSTRNNEEIVSQNGWAYAAAVLLRTFAGQRSALMVLPIVALPQFVALSHLYAVNAFSLLPAIRSVWESPFLFAVHLHPLRVVRLTLELCLLITGVNAVVFPVLLQLRRSVVPGYSVLTLEASPSYLLSYVRFSNFVLLTQRLSNPLFRVFRKWAFQILFDTQESAEREGVPDTVQQRTPLRYLPLVASHALYISLTFISTISAYLTLEFVRCHAALSFVVDNTFQFAVIRSFPMIQLGASKLRLWCDTLVLHFRYGIRQKSFQHRRAQNADALLFSFDADSVPCDDLADRFRELCEHERPHYSYERWMLMNGNLVITRRTAEGSLWWRINPVFTGLSLLALCLCVCHVVDAEDLLSLTVDYHLSLAPLLGFIVKRAVSMAAGWWLLAGELCLERVLFGSRTSLLLRYETPSFLLTDSPHLFLHYVLAPVAARCLCLRVLFRYRAVLKLFMWSALTLCRQCTVSEVTTLALLTVSLTSLIIVIATERLAPARAGGPPPSLESSEAAAQGTNSATTSSGTVKETPTETKSSRLPEGTDDCTFHLLERTTDTQSGERELKSSSNSSNSSSSSSRSTSSNKRASAHDKTGHDAAASKSREQNAAHMSRDETTLDALLEHLRHHDAGTALPPPTAVAPQDVEDVVGGPNIDRGERPTTDGAVAPPPVAPTQTPVQAAEEEALDTPERPAPVKETVAVLTLKKCKVAADALFNAFGRSATMFSALLSAVNARLEAFAEEPVEPVLFFRDNSLSAASESRGTASAIV